MSMGKFFRVYEKFKPPSPRSIILEQRNYRGTLLLESQAVAELSLEEVDSLKLQYTKVLEACGCLGVLQFHYGENTFLYLVMVTGCISVGKLYDSEIFRITQVNFIPLHQTRSNVEDRIANIRKLLNSGTFYFSWSAGSNPALDVTLSAQRRCTSNESDNRFFWNQMLHTHLQRFGINTDHWLLKTMCGSIEIKTIYVGHKQTRAVLISRLSTERAGTRFNVRGVNDDGHVANFVETEQAIYLDNEVSSYVQTRGSVPLFWEQPGVQVGSHKIKISRGFEASTSAFDRHFSLLKWLYGKQVIVNLLSSNLIGSKEGEAMLSRLFQSHYAKSQHKDVAHILFDYHQECRGGNLENLSKLRDDTSKYLEDFSLFYAVGAQIMQSQIGTIRTNCLDCIDRTNSVQSMFALDALKQQLELIQLSDKPQTSSRFHEVLRQMWINNGNEISKIYTGTGSLQGSSKLMDSARSAARSIQNNFLDSNKQEAIDILLLGSALNTQLADRARLFLSPEMLHAPFNVLQEMCQRYKGYANIRKLRVSVATYNVNGGKHFQSVVGKDVKLSDWLLEPAKKSSVLVEPDGDDDPVDIFVVGFQEIVDLNASNLVAASSENAKAWAVELRQVLSRDHEYVIVTYQQLVGVCLYVFIRPMYTHFLRDVAVDCVKTGFGGAAGNKGAVAIRFVLFSTSFCFVCAHFAAGQSQVVERNADFAEITRKVVFPMGRTLNAHDYVFWCGDFNYRVDMDKDDMKDLIQSNELAELLQYDQLKIQQQLGNVFKNYFEGPIKFPPTYKYDLFSDNYDSSEKCRQPAWTDRILWKRQKLMYDGESDTELNTGKLVYYGRSELKLSDHRPVIATIDVDAYCVDKEKQYNVFRNVVQDLGPPDATIILRLENGCDDFNNVFDDAFTTILVQGLSQIGEIVLVRFVDDTIWITFRDGQSALTAVRKSVIEVCNKQLRLTLKSPNWVACIEKELGIFQIGENGMQATAAMNVTAEVVESKPTLPIRSPPSSRPIPPVRPPKPASLQRNTITETESSEARDSQILPTGGIYEDFSNILVSDKMTLPNLEHAEMLAHASIHLPLAPSKDFDLPPPEVPAPILATALPPPVPARSRKGPPAVPPRSRRK